MVVVNFKPTSQSYVVDCIFWTSISLFTIVPANNCMYAFTVESVVVVVVVVVGVAIHNSLQKTYLSNS